MNEYSFDDLQVGKQEILTVNITEADIDCFAAFSGDFSSIHLEEYYAQGRGFKARIAHGLLVGSYISALIGMKLPGKHGLLQSINCQFRAPCYAPNTLTITGTVSRRSESIRVVGLQISVTDKDGVEIVRADANSVMKY